MSLVLSKIDLKWRILITVILVGIAIYAIYPPLDTADREGKLNLGLDLQGGIHMVMDDKTEEAVDAELVLLKSQFEQQMRRDKIRDATVTVLQKENALRFEFSGQVEQDEIFRILVDHPYDVTKDREGDKYILVAQMQGEVVRRIKERALAAARLKYPYR